jgi:hypothetical protein
MELWKTGKVTVFELKIFRQPDQSQGTSNFDAKFPRVSYFSVRLATCFFESATRSRLQQTWTTLTIVPPDVAPHPI